ncbi:peptide/nickel transport system substrate-binding protein [Arboricoccus pini]|uniref:Peptide/nickel transport system substrate-binding protein n=1 Tax=Arboricoccus pini TaxID=1963835 RepID=A0A212Q187_9PROT|nr:ABC transporter substrate-binding protein [Arboricoccus pini]SNB53121.1 peptide/nickel transport system substrate-binding protein [Arboricoccus pini]
MSPWINRVVVSLSILLVAETVKAEPPATPLVVNDMATIGRPGGELHMLISREADTRLLYIYGHARLVGYDRKLNLHPDILESYDIEDDRVFTMHLRKGHRWSDGQPFTTEDFRFWWEDIANNKRLRPSGPPIWMLVDGKPPRVDILDAQTIRYSWDKPNPFFLSEIASASAEVIYAPAHYLKQFHERYADPATLAQLVASSKSRDWGSLFGRRDRATKFDSPDMPTLQPWMLANGPPADRYVAVRNPYYYKVDSKGQQLPYIDKLIFDLVDTKLVPVKTGAGETDLQARGLSFKDYTFLRDSETRNGLATLLWPEGKSSHLAIYPNLNATDPDLRDLIRDRRFRLALSLSLDRKAISEYLYFGLATPANNTVLDASPLYSDEVGRACLGHDLDKANQLLDEIGLARRNSSGVRLMPDGRPLDIVLETEGGDTEQADLGELVRDMWREIGIAIHVKPADREVLRDRVFAGDAVMTITSGIDNGLPTAEMSPDAYAPTSQFDQLQWPKWGQYYETSGQAGEKPDLPAAKELMELYAKWVGSDTQKQRAAIWKEILPLYANQCFTIGTVASVQQPIAVRKTLRNVPAKAVWNWEPQAQFGLYNPETFWLDNP